MEKSTKILGALALISTLSFLYKSSRENGENVNSQIEGLNVDINTDKIIDSSINKLKANPRTKQVASGIAKHIVSGIIDKKFGIN